jgi:TonB family protein
MKQKKKTSPKRMIWITSGVVGLVLVFSGVLLAKVLLDDDPLKKKQVVHTVSLLKPPPPPPPKEKPPEPEVKKQEIVEKKEEAKQEESKEAKDDKPAGSQLGVDADGSGGSDGFGLVANKGGRALLGGDSGGDFLKKYGWYTSLIQEELKKRVKQHLDQNGGIPKGKLEAVVRIVVDESGNIVGFALVGSSGNHGMDEAVKLALSGAKVNESPPEGMPRTVKLKVSSQG